MLDAVNFELLGVPAAAILSEPFIATGLAMAELQGIADYPFASVPHPVTSLSADQVIELADAITPAVEALLVGQPLPQAASRSDGATLLDELVDSLAEGFRTDGADMTAERHGGRIVFELHIPTQACAECIMPADWLLPMFQQQVDAAFGPGLIAEIVDPRLT